MKCYNATFNQSDSYCTSEIPQSANCCVNNCTTLTLPFWIGSLVRRFSGCLTRIHLKFWCMRTDECAQYVPSPFTSTHDIDLMMHTKYSGSDFKYKACFNRPYLHACANFLNGSWSSNLKTSVQRFSGCLTTTHCRNWYMCISIAYGNNRCLHVLQSIFCYVFITWYTTTDQFVHTPLQLQGKQPRNPAVDEGTQIH